VNLRERNNEIQWTKRVTARLKPYPDETRVVQLWPRVEKARSFVLSELRSILLVGQNRVEMRLSRSNPSQNTLWASRVEM
jgi:hypothetical protein